MVALQVESLDTRVVQVVGLDRQVERALKQLVCLCTTCPAAGWPEIMRRAQNATDRVVETFIFGGALEYR